MAGVISLILDTRLFFLLVFAIFAILVAVILTMIEMKLRTKVVEVEKEVSYSKKLRQLLSSSNPPQEKLSQAKEISKQFFSEKLNLNPKLSYSELKQIFENPERRELVTFCDMMTNAYYSDEALTKTRVESIINTLINGINNIQKEIPQKPKVIVKSPLIIQTPGFSDIANKLTSSMKLKEIRKEISESNQKKQEIKVKREIAHQEQIKKIEEKRKEEELKKAFQKPRISTKSERIIPKPAPIQIKESEIKEEEPKKKKSDSLEIKPQIKVIHEAKDEQENNSFFVHHESFSNARKNFGETKGSIKKISSKIEQSKDSTLKESLNVSNWAREFDEAKEKIEDIYKGMLSKL